MRSASALCWSGGKDSALALWRLRAEGRPPRCLLTTVSEGGGVAMHAVRRELVREQARRVGLALVEVEIPAPCPDDVYEARMAAALAGEELRGVGEVAFGDLFLQDIRAYREERLAGAGLRARFPVWGLDTAALARRFVALGFKAILVCVDPRVLDASFAGRELDERLLSDLPEGVDPCGENGEFHTFVYDGPLFERPVGCRRGAVCERDGFVFCDLLAADGGTGKGSWTMMPTKPPQQPPRSAQSSSFGQPFHPALPPQRICSLLPSATEIVAQLGLADSLVGVSAECRWPAEVVGKPVVSAARVETSALSSPEIDRLVRDSTAAGGSLYALDAELIERLKPDLIVTQDLCAVCAVSSEELASACPLDVETISLDPRTFADVAESVLTLARRLGAQRRGEEIAAEMWEKARAVQRAVAVAAAGGQRPGPRPKVFLAEWIDPPYCGGHWVPEMIEMAGGVSLLGRAGEPAYAVSWEDVIAAEPDLVVIAPCGFDAEGAAERAAGLPELPCRIVAVDADGYYSRPGPRLADGVRQLGHLLYPGLVPDPGLAAVELR